MFNACDDRRVRDADAIDFNVIDSCGAGSGYADSPRHGRLDGPRIAATPGNR